MPKSSRPGPLQELPLDLFLPPNPNLPERPNKRVHSPGGPSLFSPTKRRILAEEGLISSEDSPKRLVRVRALPIYRDVGGDSPAKKLDFGLPKNSPARARVPPSASNSPSTRLTRPRFSSTLPDTLAPTSPLSRDAQEMNDYFSPLPHPTPPPLASVATPRELPSPVDPQSIHYPGFAVFLDQFIVTNPVTDHDAETLALLQKDEQKENLAPRRKPRKSVSAPASDLNPRLASSDAKFKANSSPNTPGRSLARERSNSATPTSRRPGVVLTRDTRLTPRLLDAERREMKKRLAEEVDEINSDKEDGALL
ncbi:hypothetical protein C8J57DRAFT_1294194 [Mycena rebaudengoi]|nr:hypothetical protein C8J57DRAFT_1294194 [Mycena rebaudengoi]